MSRSRIMSRRTGNAGGMLTSTSASLEKVSLGRELL